MSNLLLILLAVVALSGGFGLYQLSRRDDAENKLRVAQAAAENAARANERIRAQALAAQRESVKVDNSIAARSERATGRKETIQRKVPDAPSHNPSIVYADLDACVDDGVIGVLNDERADFPSGVSAGPGDDDQGAAAAACVTVRDLAEADRDAAQRYNDLAERHNSLVDQVTSHQVESCDSTSRHSGSCHSNSSDYSSSDSSSSSSDW